MLSLIQQAVSEAQVDAEIELITTIDEMMKYHTWILPTLVINNEIIARGAIPPKEVIITRLNNN